MPARLRATGDDLATRRALGGLMALAVIAIAAHHAAQPQVFAGDLGVVVFLLSAGYLLSLELVAGRDWSGPSLRRFWGRNLAAIYPAVVALVVVFAFGAKTLSGSFSRYIRQSVEALTFTVNLGASAKQNLGPFLHLWPFAMEQQWFLVLAVVALWLRRRVIADRLLIDVLLGLAVLSSLDELATSGFGPTAFRPDAQVAPLALATAVALSRTGDVQGWRGWRPTARTAAAAGVVIVGCVIWGTAAAGTAGGLRIPVASWAGAVVLAHVTASGAGASPVAQVLGWAPLAGLGRFATAFYLWHYPMLHWIGWRPDRAAGTAIALGVAAVAAVITQLALDRAPGWSGSDPP